MEINMNDKKYLKWYQKLAYGSGDLASNCKLAGLVSSFLLLYLSDVMGLKTNIIGTLMLVSKVFDGVTDVFFGNMIDKTKSRLGKAHRGCCMHRSAYLSAWYYFFNPEYGTNCAICIFLCILYLSERDFLHSKRCCILDTVSTDYQ